MTHRRLPLLFAAAALLGTGFAASTGHAGSWRREASKLGNVLERELGLAQTAGELQDAVDSLEREALGIEYDAAILDHAGRESMRRLDAYRAGRDDREAGVRKRARALVKLARGGALRIAFEDVGSSTPQSTAVRVAAGRDLRWLVRHDLTELSMYERAESRAHRELLAASRDLQALSAIATVQSMQALVLDQARETVRPQLRDARRKRKRMASSERTDERALKAQRKLMKEVRRTWIELAKLEGLGRRGRVMRPVKGRIVGKFGEYEDAVLRLPMIRNGVELAAKRDQEVHAIDDGRVVMVTRLPGFEDVVVLDHGDGEFTMTGRLWKVGVVEGQDIERGDVLGRTAPKAIDDGLGPTVYLELRHGDRPVDPLPHLRRARSPG